MTASPLEHYEIAAGRTPEVVLSDETRRNQVVRALAAIDVVATQ
jgi:hypothetical protein